MASLDDPAAQALAHYLQSVDARCPHCGYQLRGNQSSACPECGAALRLALAMREHLGWRGAWLAGVFGLTLASLVLVMLLALILRPLATLLHYPQVRQLALGGFASSDTLPNWSSIVATTALAILALTLLAIMLSSRRAFSALPRAAQFALGLAAAVSPLVVLGGLALLIRVS